MDTAEIKEVVRGRYGAFAETGGTQEACCAAMAAPASGYATELGLYNAEELALVPKGAVSLSRGCGNPTGFAGLQAGEEVVDFGCGGGIDVILAAHKVASTGRVIGLDMTPQMIEGAGRNVELKVADLAATGLPDSCADVVISNCVINLCPDKAAVYREALRLLRPGGRLAISDVVATAELPAELAASFQSTWAGCVGGAIPAKLYFETVRRAGFEHVSVVSEHPFSAEELEEMACCPGPEFTPKPDQADLDVVQGKITSIKFTAHKPG